MNLRPSGYEPDELPDCSTPRQGRRMLPSRGGIMASGTLRAEATLALANGLFLGFLMLGGIVLPLDHLPAPLAALASALPANALAEVFRVALGGSADLPGAVALLAAWGVAATILAARAFRWE